MASGLIIMSYENALLAERLKDRLDEIHGARRR
jgi:hypothetical protein